MFEGLLIGKYTIDNKPVREGDLIYFEFKEPGKHVGYKLSKAKGIVKYDVQTSSFIVVVKNNQWDYNDSTESIYSTHLNVCPFRGEISDFPVTQIFEIVASNDYISEEVINETINQLVFLHTVANSSITKNTKAALFSAIEILEKIKNNI